MPQWRPTPNPNATRKKGLSLSDRPASQSENVVEDEIHAIENAALVGIRTDADPEGEAQLSLEELERLVDSAGAEIRGSQVVYLRKPKAATYISSGLVRDIADWADMLDADIVVFDHDLSPVQQRNLQKATGRGVVTRTEVILDIFAQHARTRESMTQVELAQLRYRMPRLIGAPIASARMGGVGRGSGGGIATRGPGETQLEVDRRRIRERIHRLEGILERIERRREVQRRRRMRQGLPLVGIVGYTNAGKSTLLNRLTEAGVLAQDRLFATLDTTVRSLSLPNGMEVGLIDTVGFVSKLPPTLVAAFRATLEEIRYADIILHVVDATSPRQTLEFQATSEILTELGCENKPRLTVWNKIDLLGDPVAINALEGRRSPSAAVSALTGQGVESMLGQVQCLILLQGNQAVLRIPYDQYELVARVHREGQVLDTRDTPEGHLIRCILPSAQLAALAAYRLGAWPENAPQT